MCIRELFDALRSALRSAQCANSGEAGCGIRPEQETNMVMRSNFIADLAQMANGAASAFGGMREEIDNIIRQRLERSLNSRGLVTREEFDALRTRHEALAARLAMLESAADAGAPQGNLPKTAVKAVGKTKKPAKKSPKP
ncbi:MAG: accessory factor UbiK family protein [Candidatus Puniceispirillum sp.]